MLSEVIQTLLTKDEIRAEPITALTCLEIREEEEAVERREEQEKEEGGLFILVTSEAPGLLNSDVMLKTVSSGRRWVNTHKHRNVTNCSLNTLQCKGNTSPFNKYIQQQKDRET